MKHIFQLTIGQIAVTQLFLLLGVPMTPSLPPSPDHSRLAVTHSVVFIPECGEFGVDWKRGGLGLPERRASEGNARHHKRSSAYKDLNRVGVKRVKAELSESSKGFNVQREARARVLRVKLR